MQTNPKPVRKISRSHSSLRGKVFSSKTDSLHDFESALERDYLSILEFEPLVLRYVVQPVEIEFKHENTIRCYTPDVLVQYVDNDPIAKKFKPQLTEIKYSDELKKNIKEYQPKFDAAEAFAQKKGWTFKVLTEKEIRTPYLQNAKFLVGYKEVKNYSSGDYLLLYDMLKKAGPTTPQQIIDLTASDFEKKGQLIYCLWHMVATGLVLCDLTQPITMSTEIWIL